MSNYATIIKRLTAGSDEARSRIVELEAQLQQMKASKDNQKSKASYADRARRANAAGIEHGKTRIAELEAKNTRLQEALKPFAALAERFDPPEQDDDCVLWGEHRISVGMFRLARKALAASGPELSGEKQPETEDRMVFTTATGKFRRVKRPKQ